MSRNFELMTQLGLEVGAIDEPKPDATNRTGPSDVVFTPSGDASNVSEEEMARFLLQMFPRGGGGPKE
ncbi:MAG: hypothetical protein ACLQDA_10810 [Terracidiphilus sp.]